MSLIGKINNLYKIERNIHKGYLINCAHYSRRSDSKKHDSPFKVVDRKDRFDGESEYLTHEGGPNWELFAPRGNRFYLPGSLGPAWQGATTTLPGEAALEHLIDFESKANNKLHVSTSECPTLLRKNLHELFPAPEIISPNALTLITLSFQSGEETEKGATNFVLAAKEICSRLRLNGFWADFMNPFSGKPFHSYASGKNLYKIDERFRGLGMKLLKQDNCLVISPDEEITFSGNVFTNAPSDLYTLQSLIME